MYGWYGKCGLILLYEDGLHETGVYRATHRTTHRATHVYVATHGCDMSTYSRLHLTSVQFLSWLGSPLLVALKACEPDNQTFPACSLFLFVIGEQLRHYSVEGMYIRISIYESYASTAGGTQPGTSRDLEELQHSQCTDPCVCQVCF